MTSRVHRSGSALTARWWTPAHRRPGRDDARISYVDTVVRKTFGVEGLSDAVFWPQEFFGRALEGEPSAAQIVDEVLSRRSHG